MGVPLWAFSRTMSCTVARPPAAITGMFTAFVTSPPSSAASTFPVGLLAFVSKFSVDFGQMMAAGVLALLPVCVFFVFIQRHLVQGLTAGAVKG